MTSMKKLTTYLLSFKMLLTNLARRFGFGELHPERQIGIGKEMQGHLLSSQEEELQWVGQILLFYKLKLKFMVSLWIRWNYSFCPTKYSFSKMANMGRSCTIHSKFMHIQQGILRAMEYRTTRKSWNTRGNT